MTPVPPPGLASPEGARPDDRRLRAALQRFPRTLFVPTATRSYEAELHELPPEQVVIALFDALALDGTERVLEIGSSTAYLTALLSHLAGEVCSVTLEPQQVGERARALSLFRCNNVEVVHAEPHTGWPPRAPYQAIVVGAGASEVPLELIDQLDVGGRLVIPIGDADAQMLECMRKRKDAVDSQTLSACRLKMLAGTRRSPSSYPWTRPRDA
jgi:protein-L-isoaspartate(D-aspartate) O-methyltransferase